MMRLIIILLLLIAPVKGEVSKIQSSLPAPHSSSQSLQAPSSSKNSETTGRLARALQRLQGHSKKSAKDRYQVVPLLGGRLLARVPSS